MKPQLAYLLLLLLVSAFAFQINIPEESTVLGDEKGNVTDAELSQMKKLIQEAQAQYNSTDFGKVAKYVFTGMKNVSSGLRWNVYVHEGKINQIGLTSQFLKYNKYIWLLNYGKYNFTYTLFAQNSALCDQFQQFGGGGGIAQFGEGINDNDKQKIFAVVDNSLIYKGDDIQQASAYISDKVGRSLGYGVWATMIADPNTRYGYYLCRAVGERWFALRAYKDFKWNYLGTMH